MRACVRVYVCVSVVGDGGLPVPAQVRGVGGGRVKERERKRDSVSATSRTPEHAQTPHGVSAASL